MSIKLSDIEQRSCESRSCSQKTKVFEGSKEKVEPRLRGGCSRVP